MQDLWMQLLHPVVLWGVVKERCAAEFKKAQISVCSGPLVGLQVTSGWVKHGSLGNVPHPKISKGVIALRRVL